MTKILLYGFLLYLAYNFIFKLVIPVSKATSQVKDKLREMQEQQAAQQQAFNQQTKAEPVKTTEKSGDYIEYEEVK